MELFYQSEMENQLVKKINTSVGYDVKTPISFNLPAKDFYVVDLKLQLLIPENYWVKIESRSGLAIKGIFTIGGIIDNDYTGDIKVALVNMSNDDYHFNIGDRICQFVIYPENIFPFKQVDFNTEFFQKMIDKKEKTRGKRGFGSTGK